MNDILIIGERYRGLFGNFLSNIFDILYLPDNPNVAPALAGHADLSLFNLGSDLICANYLKGSSFISNLTARGVHVVFDNSRQVDVYPFDCGLNALATDELFIYNPRTCSQLICDTMLNRDYIPVKVKQGYVRCTALFIGSCSCITADNGIAAALNSVGCRVLSISDKGISLPGYSSGFIGGASFIHNNNVYFFGDISLHPSYSDIKVFIEQQGMRIISLSNTPLLDIGGAVLIQHKGV